MKPYMHKVQYYETDKMGITHHSNYIRFMEEARVDFLEQIGWGYDMLEKEGLVSPVVSTTCNYKKATTYPDEISINVNVLECGGVKVKFGYTMTVDDGVVCTATSVHCFLNEQGRPISYEKQYPGFFQALLKAQQKEDI